MSKTEGIESREEKPEAPGIFKWDGSRMRNLDPSGIGACDFRNPGILGQTDLMHLGTMQQKLVQHLSARLSTFLRMECTLRTTKFGPSTFEEFVSSISDPAHITLFQAEPLRGVGILDLSVRLGLVMADRILGGKGLAAQTDRHLTEIELALVEDAIDLILTGWAGQWGSESGLHPQRIGYETNARFLQTSRPDATMIVGAIEVMLGESIEQMQIAIPVSMIEPLVAGMRRDARGAEQEQSKQIQWRAPYDSIVVPVTAEWAVREMTVREVLDLEPGHVIEMPRELITQTRIRFADAHEFEGTIGLESGRVAVQLTKRNHLEQQT